MRYSISIAPFPVLSVSNCSPILVFMRTYIKSLSVVETVIRTGVAKALGRRAARVGGTS